MSLLNTSSSDARIPPAPATSSMISTADGETLETWRLAVEGSNQAAIIFHGNAGDVENFFAYQKYFESIGITSYGFDYRGYGRSSGWPSEEGLYRDTEAIVEYVIRNESIDSSSLILTGVSIGSGAAAYGAAKYAPGALVLFSPFVSLREVVKAQPVLGYLHPFLFFEFPVAKHVTALKNTCLFVAHGRNDNVVDFFQGERVFKAYSGNAKSAFLPSDIASHNDILFKIHKELSPFLKSCFQFSSL